MNESILGKRNEIILKRHIKNDDKEEILILLICIRQMRKKNEAKEKETIGITNRYVCL